MMIDIEEKGKQAELVRMKVDTLGQENAALKRRADNLASELSKKWVKA